MGPGLPGNAGLGGIGSPGALGPLAYQSAFPGAFGPASMGPQPKVASNFNNLGHWYNPRGTGYTGHWYPNGLANGRGVLGYGGSGMTGASGGGGGSGGLGGPQGGSGTNRMGSSMIGNVGGTALGVGAMMNQFRR